jgi:hypothetical protein
MGILGAVALFVHSLLLLCLFLLVVDQFLVSSHDGAGLPFSFMTATITNIVLALLHFIGAPCLDHHEENSKTATPSMHPHFMLLLARAVGSLAPSPLRGRAAPSISLSLLRKLPKSVPVVEAGGRRWR